jgi:hypothetical protein
MATRIQIRQDTSDNWEIQNPILAVGELAVESDTLRIKVGNGTLAWNDLFYITDVSVTDLLFSDQNKITIGTDLDFKFYHNNDNNYITAEAAGSAEGNLFINAESELVLGTIAGEKHIRCVNNAGVTLHHDNIPKLYTTSSGVQIPNNLIIDQNLTVTSPGSIANINDMNVENIFFGDETTAQTTAWHGSASTEEIDDDAVTTAKINTSTTTDEGQLGDVLVHDGDDGFTWKPAGSVIQVITKRVDDMIYWNNVNQDGAAISYLTPLHIEPLDITITPKSADSKIIIMWNIMAGIHDSADGGYRIYKDGEVITTSGEEGYNPDSTDTENIWNFYFSHYDQNGGESTLINDNITYIASSADTNQRTYELWWNRNTTSGYYALNRTRNSAGQSGYENAVSNIVVFEVLN